jgi:hypothetical protein
MARSMAYAFDVVLIDLVARPAARASHPTWSTPGRPWRNRRSEDSERTMSSKTACEEVVLAVELAVGVTDPA